LERLYVGGPKLTDRSLALLANLKTLSELHVAGAFTDEGLRHLEKLPKLSVLFIKSDNMLSLPAIKRLKSRSCHVVVK